MYSFSLYSLLFVDINYIGHWPLWPWTFDFDCPPPLGRPGGHEACHRGHEGGGGEGDRHGGEDGGGGDQVTGEQCIGGAAAQLNNQYTLVEMSVPITPHVMT